MFYERLNYICKSRNTTITTLLKKLKINTGLTGYWKKGKIPNGETLIKIANELNVSIDYLLERTNNPEIND